MTVGEIISAIGLIGIGGLVKSFFDLLLANKKQQKEAQHQHKEVRYKAIILLNYIYLYYDVEQNKLADHRPNIKTKEDLHRELCIECINMVLYASDDVIHTMKQYVETPTLERFNQVALSMRRDLYGIKSKLKSHNINIQSDTTLKNN